MMKRYWLILVLWAWVGSGCASTPSSGPAASGGEAAPGAAASGRTDSAEAERRASEAAKLAIWDDPAFQRKLAESYIAETEIEPTVTSTEREVLREVFNLIQEDKLDDAAAVLRENRGEASTAVMDFTLANIHFQREQFDRAAELYRVAVHKYPKFRRAWDNLGKIHVRRGEYEGAIEALTRVIELGGNDGLTYGLLGVAHSSLDDEIAAESAFRKAIMLDPDTSSWRMGLARSFFRQQRYAEAVAFVGKLIEADRDRAELWLLQANAYLGMDKPMEAAENFELVDELGGSTVASLYTLGDIYVNEELYDLAVDAYVRAMGKDEEGDADRAVRAAKVLAGRGALAETDQLVERIQSDYAETLEDEQEKDLLKLQARIAVAEGADEREAEILKQIVKLDPTDGEALMLLGQHYRRKGKFERAIFYYERAASLPEYEADAKVRQAQVLVSQGRFEEALPLLRSAQQIEPRENVQEYLQQVERVARSG